MDAVMYQKVPRRDSLLRLHSHDFGPAEEAAVLEVLRSGWLTRGPRTQQFELEFAARVAAPHALGLNSCTAALHLALLCGGVGPGDEVIVPALTFAATANTVVHCGATPVFADVLPDSQCIDPASVERLINGNTKAIVPVHYGGIACEIPRLQQLAGQHGLFVSEDCAHAVETELDGRPVGVASGSRFASYSFYATKNLITAEGGMLCCRDEADLERARVIGLHGMSRNAWKRYSGEGFQLYDIEAAGFKYNMFDIQAALGMVQLAKLNANHARRTELAALYASLLADDPRIEIPQAGADSVHAHHLMVVRLSEDWSGSRVGLSRFEARNTVISALREEMVESYVHYISLPGTRFYREQYGTAPSDCPVAQSVSERVISLPIYPDMQDSDVEYCCLKLREVLDGVE
ncbi:MAG: DegT/DnrJ/EryC1/StrS family aminotransferase [Planctomycetales bacterium]|nr:DegT/DnrJ/EryC1/StrS family aminotransferase [bacterium]UNM09771.1 MAG: DegT/DnrJ/EryC1/StrS family aminotransferase [Planctomycetales bacterium]